MRHRRAPARRLVELVSHQRYLFFALAAVLIALPLLPGLTWHRQIGNALFGLIVVTGPATLARNRRSFLVSAALAATMYLASWSAIGTGSTTIEVVAGVAAVAFFGHLCVLIYSRHLFGGAPVTGETLVAAVNAYLALGLTFAFAFRVASFVLPVAFNGAPVAGPPGEPLTGFVYYSFVTLTTLGYGDVTPAHPVTQMLAYVEALTGQLYVALTIARVVGIHAARQTPSDGPRS